MNKKYAGLDFPAWFDGKDVNEAAFAGSFYRKTSSSMRTKHFYFLYFEGVNP